MITTERSDRGFKAMKFAHKLTCLVFLLAGIFSASTAMACSVDAWNGGVTGSPLAGSPSAVSRVSGACAMKLTAPGTVKDTSPAAETAAIIRFYVLAKLSAGSPVIFKAFSDDNATTSLLTVSFNGSNFVFNAGAGASGNVPGKAGWNLVEISWTSGGKLDYWVNTDSLKVAATGSISAAAGTMESVVLGTSDSYTGSLTFDDYESHRSTPVGALMAGDGNSDGKINSGDINVIVNEFLFGNLGAGIVDCNLDGAVNSGDINCVVAIFLGL